MTERTIWKYPLQLNDHQFVDMPLNAEILSADNQDGVICIWAMVDPTAPPETRQFRIAGTGHPVGPDVEFIGTVLMEQFVWHVFEIPA